MQPKPKLLIVDDDKNIRTQMKWALVDDYQVLFAEDRESAIATVMEEEPPVVLLDLGLPPHPGDPTEGFRTLEEISTLQGLTKVIVTTGQSEKENSLQAVAAGAYDFLSKPVDTAELQIILKRAFHLSQLEQDYRELQAQMPAQSFGGMLGASPQIQAAFKTISKVATTDAPVLVLGESGTGKEMAARAVHDRSARSEGPFAAINCSAIPDTLLESELFGHEKGSFTGAHEQRKGRIEMANGGSLFLDEIGELPAAVQVKLLRFLQDKQIERVGGRTQIDIDARVISATNADLEKAMSSGNFREDLYYRLAVVVLRMPPLREREGDTEMLAMAFLKRFAAEGNQKVTGFTQHAMQSIRNYAWPGNVRELENRVRRAAIMAEGRRIKLSDLELGTAATGYEGLTLKEAREALEGSMVRKALARHKGNITRAARDLGISRPTLYELISRLDIKEAGEYRTSDGGA